MSAAAASSREFTRLAQKPIDTERCLTPLVPSWTSGAKSDGPRECGVAERLNRALHRLVDRQRTALRERNLECLLPEIGTGGRERKARRRHVRPAREAH